METRGRSTRAGVLFWTPAPQHPSPSTSIDSDVDWWDEDEEEGGDRKEEEEGDFHSQMDENGIIGLENALQNVGLGKEEEEGEEEGVENGEDDLPWYSGALDPEGPREGFLSSTRAGGIGLDQRLEQVDPLEELSYNLSDLQNSEPLSQSEPPGEDTHTLSFGESHTNKHYKHCHHFFSQIITHFRNAKSIKASGLSPLRSVSRGDNCKGNCYIYLDI